MIRVIDELDTELNIGDIVLYTSSQYISHNICEILNWKIDDHYEGKFLHIGGKELYPLWSNNSPLPATFKSVLNLFAKQVEGELYRMDGALKLVKGDILGRLLLRKLNK